MNGALQTLHRLKQSCNDAAPQFFAGNGVSCEWSRDISISCRVAGGGASCDQFDKSRAPLCSPLNGKPGQYSAKLAPWLCPQAAQSAETCKKGCAGLSGPKARDCNEQCSAQFGRLYEACQIVRFTDKPSETTPKSGSDRQLTSRDALQRKAKADTIITNTRAKSRTKTKKSTSAVSFGTSNPPPKRSTIVGPGLLENGGGFVRQGPAAAGSPIGGGFRAWRDRNSTLEAPKSSSRQPLTGPCTGVLRPGFIHKAAGKSIHAASWLGLDRFWVWYRVSHQGSSTEVSRGQPLIGHHTAVAFSDNHHQDHQGHLPWSPD